MRYNIINESSKYSNLRGMYEYVGFNDSLIGMLFARFYDKAKAKSMNLRYQRNKKDLDKHLKDLNYELQAGMQAAIENEKGVKLYSIYSEVYVFTLYVKNNNITLLDFREKVKMLISTLESKMRDLTSTENIESVSLLLDRLHECLDKSKGLDKQHRMNESVSNQIIVTAKVKSKDEVKTKTFSLDPDNIILSKDDKTSLLVLFPLTNTITNKENNSISISNIIDINGTKLEGNLDKKIIDICDLTNSLTLKNTAIKFLNSDLKKDFKNYDDARNFVLKITDTIEDNNIDITNQSIGSVDPSKLAEFIRNNSGAEEKEEEMKPYSLFDFSNKNFTNQIFKIIIGQESFYIKMIRYDSINKCNYFKMIMYVSGNREKIWKLLQKSVVETPESKELSDLLSNSIFKIDSYEDKVLLNDIKLLNKEERVQIEQDLEDQDIETDSEDSSSQSQSKPESEYSTSQQPYLEKIVKSVFEDIDFEDELKGFKAREVEFLSLIKRSAQRSDKHLIDPFKIAKIFMEATYTFIVPNFEETVKNKYVLKYFSKVGPIGIFNEGAKYWNVNVMDLVSKYKEYIPESVGSFIADMLDTNTMYSYLGNGTGSVAVLIKKYFNTSGTIDIPKNTINNSGLINILEKEEAKKIVTFKDFDYTKFKIDMDQNYTYLIQGELNSGSIKYTGNIVLTSMYTSKDKLPMFIMSIDNKDYVKQFQNVEFSNELENMYKKNDAKVSMGLAYNSKLDMYSLLNEKKKIIGLENNTLSFVYLNIDKNLINSTIRVKKMQIMTDKNTGEPLKITGDLSPINYTNNIKSAITGKALYNLFKNHTINQNA